MTERVILGWRVPVDMWEEFEMFVGEKHGSTSGYLRFELECAMREFLDEDGLLVEAEELLEKHADLRGLSSSTALVRDERYRCATTRKVGHRINAELKERFKLFADKHDASTYGRLLACALDSYTEGGRARRILDDIKRLVSGGTTVDTTTDSKENDLSIETESDTTTDSKESTSTAELSSVTEDGINGGTTAEIEPKARHIIEIAERLPSGTFPKYVLEDAIVEVVGVDDQEIIEAYRDPVLDQASASPHPHNEALYITDEYRESEILYGDLDRAERICLLRRFAAYDAVDNGEQRRAFTYKQVQGLFDMHAGGGQPSHQYAYDLMAEASDEDGFKCGDYNGQKQLRVDLEQVSDSVMEFVTDKASKSEIENLRVNGLITSYTSGPAPDQEGAADD